MQYNKGEGGYDLELVDRVILVHTIYVPFSSCHHCSHFFAGQNWKGIILLFTKSSTELYDMCSQSHTEKEGYAGEWKGRWP